MKKFYGTRRYCEANVFGRSAGHLAQNAFDSQITAQNIVLKHSAWPVYSRLLTQQFAHAWYVRVVSAGGGAPNQKIHGPHIGQLHPKRWQSCPTCVAEQQKRLGIGHWMVVHQLPGIHHCPKHSDPLAFACGACGVALGDARQTLLPGDPCSSCGSISRRTFEHAISTGEQELGRLYQSLLIGEGPNLDPIARYDLQHEIGIVVGNMRPAISPAALLRAFDCGSAAELGTRLRFQITPGAMGVALAGGSLNAAPAPLHLAVAAVVLAMRAGRIEIGKDEIDESRPFMIPQAAASLQDVPSEAVIAEIVALAADHNISPAAVYAALAGSTAMAIEKSRLATSKRLRQFILGLPVSLSCHFNLFKGKSPAPDVPRRASDAQKLDAFRARIERELLDGASNREQLSKRCQAAYRWTLRFDRDWLDIAIPAHNSAKARGRSKK